VSVEASEARIDSGAAGAAGGRRLSGAPALFVCAGAALAAGLLLAFWYAPVDASSMGFSQKIFYYHVPIAWAALVAFSVAFVAGILYLRSSDLRYDRLGLVGVRLGLLFSLLVMGTGMIWGKAAWGAWWAWEPRLTTFLIACLLYAGYFVLRSMVDEEARRATYAAVFAIIAFVDVPITFFATRFLPEGLHPVVLRAGDAGMEGSMLLSLLVSVLGMTLLLAGLIRLEYAAERLRDEIADLKDRLGEVGQ
jgi:heme exporter protein C